MKHSIILFLALAFGYSQGMNDDIQLAQVRVSGNAITSVSYTHLRAHET